MPSTSDDKQKLLRMEGILTGLLRYGALFASAWLACGMALGSLPDPIAFTHNSGAVSHGCLVIGIVLLIALPVLRVAIMMVIFLLERDYRFAAISAAVLSIITLGFLLGTMNSHIDFL
jgi:Protein of unknown function (DUF1634)